MRFWLLNLRLGFRRWTGRSGRRTRRIRNACRQSGPVALVELFVPWFALAGVVVAGFLAAGFGDGLAVAAAGRYPALQMVCR